jgi:uncharacterized protein YqeY
MSQLLARLQTEMKETLKAGEKARLEVIRMLLAEIKNAQVNQPGGRDREWSDAEITAIIAAYHKALVKNMAEFPADRQEKIKGEIAIVEAYLPKQMAPTEIKEFVLGELRQTSERNFGLLMKIIQPKLIGRVDGKSLSEAIKTALTEIG